MNIMRYLLEVSSNLAFRASQKAARKNKMKQALNIQAMDHRNFIRNLAEKLRFGEIERKTKFRTNMRDTMQNMRNTMDEHGKKAIDDLGRAIEKGQKTQKLGGALVGGGLLAAGAGGAALYKYRKNKNKGK
jgi:hypothetical protein